MASPDFSLVLACYNESSHIEKSIGEIVSTLENCNFSYEIILYDDKSPDDTAVKIKTLVKKYKHVRALFHKKNVGRGGTVRDGILASTGKVVGFIDIDLEVGPDYIAHFYNEIASGKADMAVATRYYSMTIWPLNALLRTIVSEVYAKIVARLLNLGLKDTEAGYKFFNRKKILEVLPTIEDVHWFWDTEVCARSKMSGLIVSQIPVLFLRNPEKKSTVKLIPDVIAFIKALAKFKKSLNQEYKAPGLLYSFPKLYTRAMQMLFSEGYSDRYKSIAKMIDDNSSVVDVCCGDAVLYDYLADKNVRYVGLDVSQSFVKQAISKNISIRLSDVARDPIPSGDYVVLQGSLYQFDDQEELVKKLFRSTNKKLIISESVNNLKHSLFGKIIAEIVPAIVGTRHQDRTFRFDEKSFKQLLSKYSPKYTKINGGRDLIAEIQK